MRYPIPTCLIALLFMNSSVAGAREVATKSVTIDRPTIVVVFPPELKTPKEDGDDEAIAHTEFAVNDTLKCLKPRKPKVVTLYADRVKVIRGKVATTLDITKKGEFLGVILVDATHAPRAEIPTIGPSALQFSLPMAASEYWGSKKYAALAIPNL